MNDTSALSTNYDETVPVLIVGGSLVGLSMALFLSWHGIPSLLVERHAGISPHPRAVNFNLRSMALFHSVGIEHAIRRAEPAGYQNTSVLQAESLAGREVGWITQNATGGTCSPLQGCLIGQDVMEPILRRQAQRLGGDLRFSTELVSFEQDTEGVSALIRSRTTGQERCVRARYLIAADGCRSAIRQQLNIGVQGPGVQGHQVSILFDADIRDALRGRRIAICFVNNTVIRGGTLILARGEGRGFGLYAHYNPSKGELPQDFAGERGIETVRAALGIPELPVKITAVTPWEVAAWTAERFQQGNVFLVGDAAHVNPPTGAFGANTGIADAYNLAWKVAHVLQGMAQPHLLQTYTQERQPVARFTVEQAFSMFMRLASPSFAQTQRIPVVDYSSIAFGYRYSSALLSTDTEPCYEDPYHPTGNPGTHAAHVVLQGERKQLSTFDLFGRHYVLLTGSHGEKWCKAAYSAGTSLNISLDSYRIGGWVDNADYVDVDGQFLELYGIEDDGAVLVRPDGFVAWKTRTLDDNPEYKLEQVLIHHLALLPAVA